MPNRKGGGVYKDSYIIYRRYLDEKFPRRLFDPGQASPCDGQSRLGRGTVYFFNHCGRELALKRYHRGGLLSRLVKESYLFMRLEETRMWREFHLLSTMKSLGLPVPRPVAAHCRRTSFLTYSGALICEKIPESLTLAEVISQTSLSARTWRMVGRTIAVFHEHQVDHADLNANNVLLTRDGKVYLIDFDKSAIKQGFTPDRAKSNLDRLQRSLHKLQGRLPRFHFTRDNWRALKRGYRERAGSLGYH